MIVFFDGVCNLCNSTVDWIIRHDRKQVIRLAALQSAAAREKLPADDTSRMENVVVLTDDGQVLRRSDAALAIVAQIGSPWSALGVFKVIPRPLRDLVYNLIARNRYRWFGKRETCRLPTPEDRARFLPGGWV